MPKHRLQADERRVRLFRNGRNQAIRVPREFELAGVEAIVRKEGDRLIIAPAQPVSLLAVLASLSPVEEEFPAVEDPPPQPVRPAP
jgi:antitoxin VapB